MGKRNSSVKILLFSSIILCSLLFWVNVKADDEYYDTTIKLNCEYSMKLTDEIGEDTLLINCDLEDSDAVYIVKIYNVITNYILYPETDYEHKHGVEYSDANMNHLGIEINSCGEYYIKSGSDSITIESDDFNCDGEDEIVIRDLISYDSIGMNVDIINTTFNIRIEKKTPAPKSPATSIRFPKKATVTKGFQKKLKAQPTKESSTLKGIQWKTSNKKIATVDDKGNVKGKKVGECNISCILTNGKKYVCKLKVLPNVYTGYYKLSNCSAKAFPYGQVHLELNQVYYKGNYLYVRCVALNSRIYNAVKFNKIKLVLKSSDYRVIAVNEFKNYNLNIQPYGKKYITFKFPKKSIKKKNFNLREDYLKLDYRYNYEYSY